MPFRPSHSRSRSQPYAFTRVSMSCDRMITDGLSLAPIETLGRPAEEVGKKITVKDLEYLASYNWLDTAQPTIVVPGSPPEWSNRETPYTVPPDHEVQVVDQTGYRMHSSRLLPLFRAVDIMTEENGQTLDWSAVDFCTSRNSLRKLLRWIDHEGDFIKDFRIDTELAGRRTIFLNRWETSATECVGFRSYGHTFERESTLPAQGCEQSVGHNRIVKYNFDGLILVVGFEVDAYIASPRTAKTSLSATSDIETLPALLSGLDVSSNVETAPELLTSVSDTDLKIIRAGKQVPQSSIVELKTRSKRYVAQFDWADAYPQLYLSQTPHQFLAVHDRGLFETVIKRKLGDPELQKVEEAAQLGFAKLSSILKMIQELVIKHGQRRLSLVCLEGKLQVFERTDQKTCLPEADMNRFGV
ncbi:hypothetical protein AcV5_008108 [Taiwanofungus camphoratus]|nr:hypothetical protein AcV5_008108 [Antrodia cinnamomea]KAI0930920.1 hypothetical protein AcV7_004968 [Antrodia cinnamomea]